MREILFRGKDKDGNWVEGDLVHDYIALENIDQSLDQWPDPIPVSIKEKDCFPVEVIPETVGQFTGITDKNGVKIFEGDILKTPSYEDNGKMRYSHHVVEWSVEHNGWYAKNVHNIGKGHQHGDLDLYIYVRSVNRECGFESCGNVIDNPELLK